MFFFGSPEDTAATYVEAALAATGPAVPDVHYEEMSEKELRDYYVYLRIAYFRAARDGAGDDVVNVLVRYHDEVFEYLLEALEGFRELVCSRRHQPIKDRAKYLAMAGCKGSAN